LFYGSAGVKIVPVRATGLNHVSVSALDVEESAQFYEQVFGMERLPTPTFSVPVVWLRVGDLQLHLFEQADAPAPRHHFALEVDDFEAFYLRLRELGIHDHAWRSFIYELPSGEVQMYLRDPGGNLVEIDWPDISTLDRSVVEDIRKLADDVPQGPGAEDASLFLARSPSLP
jgi:catechol 2,3-dioxygenase-like lactoylglutathione lyase family enzyme